MACTLCLYLEREYIKGTLTERIGNLEMDRYQVKFGQLPPTMGRG